MFHLLWEVFQLDLCVFHLLQHFYTPGVRLKRPRRVPERDAETRKKTEVTAVHTAI